MICSERNHVTEGTRQVDVVDSLDKCAAISQDWQDLYESSGSAHPFLRAEWHLSWLEHLRHRGEPLILTVRSAGRLVGVAPLMRNRISMGLRGLNVVTHMLNGVADYTEFLSADGCDFGLRDVMAYLSDAGWDVLFLRDVPACSSLWKDLRDSDVNPFTTIVCRGTICPYVEVSSNWSSHLKAVLDKSRKRNQLKRKLRKFSKKSGNESVTESALSEGYVGFDDMATLEKKTWKHEQCSGLFSKPDHAAFYKSAFGSLLERDSLFTHLALTRGRLSAYLVGFKAKGKYYFYSTSFDPEHAECSPGFYVFVSSIKRCFDEKGREYDMLRGVTDHKSMFTRTARHNHSVALFRSPSVANVFAGYMKAKGVARKLLRRNGCPVWKGSIETPAGTLANAQASFERLGVR